MTKQPFLTGFPLAVFATARRRLQAAVRQSRALFSRRSLSGYSVLFADFLPGDFLASIDPTERQRHFGHVPVFWAWLAQILEAKALCQKAVGLIQSWCWSCGLPVPSSDTSSSCKARGRLGLPFLHAVHRRVVDTLRSRVEPANNRWQGLNLKAIDGSSVQLMDTAANQLAYPQPSGQKPGCGFPTMGIVGLLDLGHGGWEHFETGRWSRHDSTAAAGLIALLGEGDLLLADRAFCSYELLACCLRQGCHALIRLHQSRHKALDWSHGKRLGTCDRLVTWKRPPRPAGSAASREEWERLPATLTLRLIKLHYENRAGDKAELVLVTTLTDPARHDALELAGLYVRRWDIELKLRDLKCTLGMESFAVKSPDLAHKTLVMSLIAFNLVRGIMQQAASVAGKPVWHASFKGVLDLLTSSHESFRVHAGKPRNRSLAMIRLLEIAATKLIDIRPFRKEPRAVKRRRNSYQLLTKPRHEFEEIHHRENYRKPA